MCSKEYYKVIAVVGPTASGKSGLAIQLAKEFGGEIINADSRQVYKYMDIGTAKDPDDDPNDNFYTVNGIRHHLIDFLEPDEKYSVADFKKLAEEKIVEITERGNLPILVGGTGLWVDAVCKEHYEFEESKADWNLRKELEKKSIDELFDMLWEVNPELAVSLNRSDENNPVRLIRLIEKNLQSPPDKGGLRGVEKRYIPYNKSLTIKAQQLRKAPTKAENLFWFEIIKKQIPQYKFHRQKPLLNYIVDFYCPELMLAIEIDGDVHAFQEDYDEKRTGDLENAGLTIIRYSNEYVLEANVNDIAQDLLNKIEKLNIAPSNSPLSGGRIPSSISALYLSPIIDFEQLEQRIYTRVDKMIEQGLIDEIKGLLKKGFDFQDPGMSGIGYREFKDYFSRDNPVTEPVEVRVVPTVEEIADQIKLHTRQYAKRQVTWFKRNKDINYVDFDKAQKVVKEFLSPDKGEKIL